MPSPNFGCHPSTHQRLSSKIRPSPIYSCHPSYGRHPSYGCHPTTAVTQLQPSPALQPSPNYGRHPTMAVTTQIHMYIYQTFRACINLLYCIHAGPLLKANCPLWDPPSICCPPLYIALFPPTWCYLHTDDINTPNSSSVWHNYVPLLVIMEQFPQLSYCTYLTVSRRRKKVLRIGWKFEMCLPKNIKNTP
jgi:hypothetical protein